MLNVLSDAEGILEAYFVNDKTLNERDLKKIKNEYDFDDNKNEFNEGNIPPVHDIFMVVIMENFE